MTDPAQLPLRDIHLPEGVSWWPPAPGWWILAGVLLLAGFGVWRWRRQHARVRASAAYVAMQRLHDLRAAYQRHDDPLQLVRELSILLRRMSISASGREESAGLTGEAWLQYLDSRLPEKPFTRGCGRVLIDAPYRQAIDRQELAPLLEICEQWLRAQTGRR
jgi:hypothetical protein